MGSWVPISAIWPRAKHWQLERCRTTRFIWTLWIRDPQAIKPDTLMPTVPLRDAERHDIVAYLQSLE